MEAISTPVIVSMSVPISNNMAAPQMLSTTAPPEIVLDTSKPINKAESTTTNCVLESTNEGSELTTNCKTKINGAKMYEYEVKKAPGPGVDIQVLKDQRTLSKSHLARGDPGNIGDDVTNLTNRLGQLVHPNRKSPTTAAASASGFREFSSALASDQNVQECGDVIRNQELGEKATTSTLTPKKSLRVTSGVSPSKIKITSTTRSVSAKGPLKTTASERAFSATANSPKTRISNKERLINSPLAASLSPEERKRTFGGPPSTFQLRPSSSLYRPTTSFAAKKASPQGGTARLTLKSTRSVSGSTSTLRDTPSPQSKPIAAKMGDAGGSPGEGEKTNVRDQFSAFSRFGDASSDGKQITLSNCDKWMKQAHVIDGKKITTTDTSIAFKKLFKTAKKVGFEDFKKYVEDLAKSKKLEPAEIFDKLANAGNPGLSQATKAANAGVVERLTDTSKYTGSSKERFDSAGKGKGIVGRREVAENSGYTASFNEKKNQESSPAAATASK